MHESYKSEDEAELGINCFVENVHLKGIEKTNDEYAKSFIKDIFKSSSLNEITLNAEELRKRLYATGCFKYVDVFIDAAKSNQLGLYDVYFDVEEYGPIGGGIHTNIGNNEAGVNANINFPNLFGKGEKASLEYAYGTRNNSDYRFNFQTPLKDDPDKSLLLSAFQTTNEYTWSKYNQTDVGVSLKVINPFSYEALRDYVVNGKHEFTYEGVYRNMVSFPDAAFEIRKENGHSLKSSLKYTMTIDKRTHPLMSKNGGYLQIAAELAGIGGDVNFLKITKNYQYTKTLLKYFTTEFSLSSGFMLPYGANKQISLIDKFFLGGPLNLRGFTQKGVGPSKDECSLGSDAHWLVGLHLYTPLPFFHREESLSSWFKTHTFLNVGNLFSLNSLKFDRDLPYQLTANCRLSVGSGVVMSFSNFARLELNYVWPIWKNRDDKTVNGLQLGVGITFN